MWRPAHGATNRPGPCRPTNGYGRALGRPGPQFGQLVDDDPSVAALDPAALDPAALGELGALVSTADFDGPEAEVPAPVTP
jgi:hypothetical protein